VTWIWPCRGG